MLQQELYWQDFATKNVKHTRKGNKTDNFIQMNYKNAEF